jgi:DNA mismatch repair protein MutL
LPRNYKQRIIDLFGKSKNQDLIEIKSNTTITRIRGYIGKPESAKKSQDAQFFFVNNRFMRHPYYHKAVMKAYERLLPPDVSPSYFIYFELEPEKIDVNIHPTKTEIKFEDEQSIWQILNATVKESLGKFSIAPTIDFETEPGIEIPVLTKNTQIKIPSIQIDPAYNPFEKEDAEKLGMPKFEKDYFKQTNLQNWEKLYSGFENENKEPEVQKLFGGDSESAISVTPNMLQLKNKYILSPVKSGLLIIDQKRAHERILYEKYLKILSEKTRQTQQSLYPSIIELSAREHNLIIENIDEINHGGFDIQDFGNNTIKVNGCPAEIPNPNPKELVDRLIDELNNNPQKAGNKPDYMAIILSKASAIPYGKALTSDEMHEMIDKLFACENYNYSPDGKPILSIIQMEDIEKKLK